MCAFFGKIFQNSVLIVFIVTPIDVVVFKFREIWPKANRKLFTWTKT